MDHFLLEINNIFNETELSVKLYKYFSPLLVLIKTIDKSIIINLSNKVEYLKFNTILSDIDDNIIYYADHNKLLKYQNLKTEQLTIMANKIQHLEINANFVILMDREIIRIFDTKTKNTVDIKIIAKYSIISVTINDMIIVHYSEDDKNINITYHLDGNLIDYVMNDVEDDFYAVINTEGNLVQQHDSGFILYASNILSIVNKYNVNNMKVLFRSIGQILSFCMCKNILLMLTNETLEICKLTKNELILIKVLKNNWIRSLTLYDKHLVTQYDDYMFYYPDITNLSEHHQIKIKDIKSIKLSTWRNLELPEYI